MSKKCKTCVYGYEDGVGGCWADLDCPCCACKHYGAEFNKRLKKEVANYWDNKCQFPKHTTGVSKEKNECKGKLHIHHIDYDKKNCNRDNLIPLCNKHHSTVNTNRQYWKKIFIGIVARKKILVNVVKDLFSLPKKKFYKAINKHKNGEIAQLLIKGNMNLGT